MSRSTPTSTGSALAWGGWDLAFVEWIAPRVRLDDMICGSHLVSTGRSGEMRGEVRGEQGW